MPDTVIYVIVETLRCALDPGLSPVIASESKVPIIKSGCCIGSARSGDREGWLGGYVFYSDLINRNP